MNQGLFVCFAVDYFYDRPGPATLTKYTTQGTLQKLDFRFSLGVSVFNLFSPESLLPGE